MDDFKIDKIKFRHEKIKAQKLKMQEMQFEVSKLGERVKNQTYQLNILKKEIQITTIKLVRGNPLTDD